MIFTVFPVLWMYHSLNLTSSPQTISLLSVFLLSAQEDSLACLPLFGFPHALSVLITVFHTVLYLPPLNPHRPGWASASCQPLCLMEAWHSDVYWIWTSAISKFWLSLTLYLMLEETKEPGCWWSRPVAASPSGCRFVFNMAVLQVTCYMVTSFIWIMEISISLNIFITNKNDSFTCQGNSMCFWYI